MRIAALIALFLAALCACGQVAVPSGGSSLASAPAPTQAAAPTCSPGVLGGTYTGAYGTQVTCSTTTPGCNAYVYWGTATPPTNNGQTFSIQGTATINTQVQSCPGFTSSAINSYGYAVSAPTGSLWANQLAANRATNWQQAGVRGGIPSGTWTQCGPTISAYSGTAVAIQNAMKQQGSYAGCGPNHYILLGSGTFNLSTGEVNKGISNMVLRGMGANQTKLVFSGVSTCAGGGGQCTVSFEDNNGEYPAGISVATRWTAGYSQGATQITVANASVLNINAGQTMLVLDQADTGFSGNTAAAGGGGTSGSAVDNGEAFMCSSSKTSSTGCAYNGPNGGGARTNRWQVEYHVVTACSPSCSNAGSTTLTITPPLTYPTWNSARSPEAYAIQANSYVGVEDLTIDMSPITNLNTGHFNLDFNNIHDYWVKGVTLLRGTQGGVTGFQLLYGQVEDSYVYNMGQSHNGLDPNPADPSSIGLSGDYNLVQNNILPWTRDALYMANSSVGNVWAYNYIPNCFESNTDLWSCLYDGHSAGSSFNLWEGNFAAQGSDDQTHGVHMWTTWFRNFLTGWESCSNGNCGTLPTKKNANVDALVPLSYNRLGNIMGNVFGTPGVSDIANSIYTVSYNGWFWTGSGEGHIYNMGSGNGCVSPDCAATAPIPIDPKVQSMDVWWDNWDAHNHKTMVCTGAGVPDAACPSDQRGLAAPTFPGLTNPSTALPPSFYLTARPLWWSSSIPFPAVGPDVTGGNVGACNGTMNTAGQFAGVPAFNSSQCAGQGLNLSTWNGMVNAIPAMVCFLTHGGTPDGVGNGSGNDPINFNRTDCYPGTMTAVDRRIQRMLARQRAIRKGVKK